MASDEATRGSPLPGDGAPEGSSELDDEAGPGPELERLPPPAFPPAEAREASRRRAAAVEAESGPEGAGRGAAEEGGTEEGPAEEDPDAEFPADAFISPDEPLRKVGRGVPSAAFISPEDPIQPAERDEEGRVTGIGEEEEEAGPPPADPSSPASRDDRPTIHELPYLLDGLAERINESGDRALRVHSEMGHFEAALCAFLRGYLRGSEE